MNAMKLMNLTAVNLIISLQPPGISRTSGFQPTMDPVVAPQSVATPNPAPGQAVDHLDQK